jgi:hypothetical protein
MIVIPATTLGPQDAATTNRGVTQDDAMRYLRPVSSSAAVTVVVTAPNHRRSDGPPNH